MLKKIDVLRRKLVKEPTKNIGENYRKKEGAPFEKPVIKRVLICRPNHRLGNLLLMTPIIQDITAHFPDCEIDLVLKGNMGSHILKEYPQVNRIIALPRKPAKELFNYLNIFLGVKSRSYDLSINIDPGSSTGAMLTNISNARYKIFRPYEEQMQGELPTDFKHMAQINVYTFRYFLKLNFNIDTPGPVPTLSIKLTPEELSRGKQVVQDTFSDSNKKVISIFTYATGTKCYSKEWWADFSKALEARVGTAYNILEILPVENVSQVDFKYPSFYSKDIREIAAVISNTTLFIGADSGIMHLASTAQIPIVGLFSITREYMYKPYGNGSFSLNTDQLSVGEMMDEIVNTLSRKRNA
jgi:ADP-heptose:LPS heptosyltransferase